MPYYVFTAQLQFSLDIQSSNFNWATGKGLAIITSLHGVHWKSMDQPIALLMINHI